MLILLLKPVINLSVLRKFPQNRVGFHILRWAVEQNGHEKGQELSAIYMWKVRLFELSI